MTTTIFTRIEQLASQKMFKIFFGYILNLRNHLTLFILLCWWIPFWKSTSTKCLCLRWSISPWHG